VKTASVSTATRLVTSLATAAQSVLPVADLAAAEMIAVAETVVETTAETVVVEETELQPTEEDTPLALALTPDVEPAVGTIAIADTAQDQTPATTNAETIAAPSLATTRERLAHLLTPREASPLRSKSATAVTKSDESVRTI